MHDRSPVDVIDSLSDVHEHGILTTPMWTLFSVIIFGLASRYNTDMLFCIVPFTKLNRVLSLSLAHCTTTRQHLGCVHLGLAKDDGTDPEP
jgi:hypothetical protein